MRQTHSSPPSGVTQAQWQGFLHRGEAAAGFPLAPCAAALGHYLTLLLEWNRAFNLVGSHDVGTLLERHLLDSLALHPFITGAGPVADMGTGAGLPGMVLAITDPQRRAYHLLDANGKKVRFLAYVIDQLGLAPRVSARQVRLSSRGGGALDGMFGVVTARALAGLDELAALAGPLLHSGGTLVAAKGRRVEEEVAAFCNGPSAAAYATPAIHPVGGEAMVVVMTKK